MRGSCFLAAILGISAVAVLWADDLPIPNRPEANPEAPQPLAASANRVADNQVRQWIRDLDSDTFVVRETATERLIHSGTRAIKPLVTALDGSSLEVSTRGVYVLRKLALAGDLETQRAAQDALAEVAKVRATSAARLAGDTLTMLGAIRQDRAIEELRKLGAIVTQTHRQIGFQVAEVLAIQIDENWKGKPQDSGRLRWLVDARQITLIGPQVTNDWLTHLSQLKELQALALNRTKIDHLGLAHLKDLRGIQELEIKYSPVGDAAIPLIGRFTAVQRIKLYGTQISPDGAAQLKTALANAEIDHRRGAFLGVGCEQPPLPCSIIQVQPNTAAARAELRERDVIVEYNGTKVSDFEALKKLIGAQKGGDSATIKVLRGGVRMSEELKRSKDQPLGVEAKVHLAGVEIRTVAKDSAAAAAGLKAGDVLTQFNDTTLASPEQFHQLFDKHPVDQGSVTLQIIRGSELLAKKVTFGEWD